MRATGRICQGFCFILWAFSISSECRQLALCGKAFATLVDQEIYLSFTSEEIALLESFRDSKISPPGLPQSSKSISFKGETYEIIEVLGGGYHGAVFHVRNKKGEDYSIKEYHGELRPFLQEAESQKIPSVIIRGESPELGPGDKYRERYHFVYGLTVYDIVRNKNLPQTLRDKVSAAFRMWWDVHVGYRGNRRGFTAKEDDVLVEFSSGKLFLVDRF